MFMTKTLNEFLKKHQACEDGYQFAKDLTLEQFLLPTRGLDPVVI